MSEFGNPMSSLYTRHLMRDFLAKIVPGALVIASVLAAAQPKIDTLDSLNNLPWLAWLLLFGLCWIVGFAVQSIGETARAIRYWPHGWDQERFIQTWVAFIDSGNGEEKQHYERLLVIKEACGNNYVALTIAVLVLMVAWAVDGGVSPFLGGRLVVLLFGTVLAIALGFMHFRHVKRQFQFLENVMKKYRSSSPPPADE